MYFPELTFPLLDWVLMGLFVILSNGILSWATSFVDIKLWAIIILGFLFEVSIESAPLGM